MLHHTKGCAAERGRHLDALYTLAYDPGLQNGAMHVNKKAAASDTL